MERIFAERNKKYTGLTPGKTYRIISISTQKFGSYSVDVYKINDDLGMKVDVASKLFRDFNKQELRIIKLKELGI